MTERTPPQQGTVGWIDLTVDNAEQIRDFYGKLLGWSSQEIGMGMYSDYAMVPPTADAPVAGICHAQGANADLPQGWLVYFTVADLEKALLTCRTLGGSVIVGPRRAGNGRFCVIKDPSGAVAALFAQDDANSS